MPDLLPADDPEPTTVSDPSGRSNDYVVVARRYRPQTFAELIGQEHVTRGLQAAIASGRVGHAFLFTGGRGTGKTSTARILAKALNCVQGPTPQPCLKCDICESIKTGDDVDTLEIDGASNRGIDEIRELRQNVNIRPSRARFKIYIIDEVHMLTPQAFNALLKTLEEPPAHVKFIFCTTEPDEIPITILSRCQRFDFASVEMGQIAQRLAQISEIEGVQAEPEALLLLARRAAGSMRDSQSLLEQLLAFGNQKITVADVHEMLGTAGAARLSQIVRHLAERDTAAALADLDVAVREGVDVGQLLDQLLGYFRDLMVTLAGCPAEALLYSSPGEHAELLELGRQLGLNTIMAMMQIVDQTIARLRYSMHARALAELAFVRTSKLADLEAIPALLAELRSDGANPTLGSVRTNRPAASGSIADLPPPPPPSVKKKLEEPDSNGASVAIQPANSARIDSAGEAPGPRGLASVETAALPTLMEDMLGPAWDLALASVGGLLADNARSATLSLGGGTQATAAPNKVVAMFPSQYNFGKQFCERPENLPRLEQALGEALGRAVRLSMATSPSSSLPTEQVEKRKVAPARQRMSEKPDHPWVKRAVELFDARVVWMDEPKD
ncbi:MAG: DNA polymerase III subunit gamma/tau [Pirellulales bacterium]